MKKILLVATVQSHIAQFHKPLIEMLHEKGCIVHVAAKNNLAEKNGLSLGTVEKVFDIPFSRSPFSLKNGGALKELKKVINLGDYDLIQCNTPVGGILTRIAAQKARRKGTKVIYVAHGFHFYQGSSKKNWLLYYPIEKHFAKKCDTLVTVVKEDYALAKKCFKTNVKYIHGVGVDANRYHKVEDTKRNDLREALGLNTKDFLLVCTGELNKNKNQSALIEAAAQLKEDMPNLKILLAGNGGLRDSLEEKVAKLGLKDVVYFLGYRTDLENIVPAADVVVSCSYREGLPLNIVEAMLCKIPVIGSTNRGHKELIKDGENGYLFAPHDSDRLAKLIEKLYDPEKRKILGEMGYAIAQAYTMLSVKPELEKIYEI